MLIQDCSQGQRIRYRETGRPGTIKEVYLDSNLVDIALDNGTTTRCHPRLIEPADAALTGPERPCPNCAAKMPVNATTCPACGFQYGVKTTRPSSPLLVLIVALVMAAVAACAIWRLAAHR